MLHPTECITRVISPLGCWDHFPKPPEILQGGPPRQFMGDVCVICNSSSINIGNYPCGHNCFCSACGTNETLSKIGKKCPVCRTEITSLYKV